MGSCFEMGLNLFPKNQRAHSVPFFPRWSSTAGQRIASELFPLHVVSQLHFLLCKARMPHGWATAAGLLLAASVAHGVWEPRLLLLDVSDGCDVLCNSFNKTNHSSPYAACFACCKDQCAGHGSCGDSKVDKNAKCQCLVSYIGHAARRA